MQSSTSRSASSTQPVQLPSLKAVAVKDAKPLSFKSFLRSQRLGFRKRDRRFLPTKLMFGKGSLIPVLVFYSDLNALAVRDVIEQARAVVSRSQKVYVFGKSGTSKRDEVLWEGSGSSLPNEYKETDFTIIRTLDCVYFKARCPSRQKALLQPERDLIRILEPFLHQYKECAKLATHSAVNFDRVEEKEMIETYLRTSTPFRFNVVNLRRQGGKGKGAENVKNKQGELIKFYYDPAMAVFVRDYGNDYLPLVSMPKRLSVQLGSRPSMSELLHFILKTQHVQVQLVREAMEDLKISLEELPDIKRQKLDGAAASEAATPAPPSSLVSGSRKPRNGKK
uniref:Uncharacterized protein n=1 Tax=Palpitomonas bilix TaxID=652834 RepID=A0A7S3CVW6_9EUKA|mmetsp:Transcript_11394/g.30188  ORF Transcript_11394/g.30188 Transcript_11394/m.30188 type:complete len:337 (+) Transcript_11394:505-1515(+)|eukprot:CAMPEP_0113884242 /NCGR_PEP_ID=MMETSP0780_2-20120614/10137_1 /TAXON_ID=652834 /ORGANISM="Palpitomonas bilix" /LENGTH=336 /DNA_ID=CAMNT_0000871817 /DNA_START=477 /DNA_END=1487 /DNA_ORIENTATION=- /assembly_acc=CAM_ASM_000599